MDVVILGRIGYDLYSEEPHVALPQARRFSRYLGGSSANMAVGLSRLGASVGIVSCLKLGESGTRVWSDGDSVYLPPYKVQVCTTIGAGDGFAAGFLYAILKGLPVGECLHYGNAAVAIVVSRLSCSEAMPVLGEVEEMMQRQRKA